MALKVYNTLTRQKQTFEPVHAGLVGMYACGVTPYKPSHLGHAMQAVIFDVIRRYLEYKGFLVTYVRNYTDIDDKIVAAAKETGLQPLEHSKRIMEQCDADFDALHIRRADYEPKVSDHVAEIIRLTQELIDAGYAYATDKGNVYYRVLSFKEYGQLSGQNTDDLLSGTRKESEPDKENPLDFALWKSADPDVNEFWPSPWGNGRPGWHIECSAMSSKYLGDFFDFHGGGGDLIFPHHENEIAQSAAAHNGHFAKYWLHNGLLMVGKEKMSKSLKNDTPITDWLKKYHPEVIRYLILTNHYRSNVQFVPERYRDASLKVYQGYKALKLADEKVGPETNRDEAEYQKLMNEFEEYMDNDFNTVEVIAMLHRIIKELSNEAVSEITLAKLDSIRKIGEVLGLFADSPQLVEEEMKNIELFKLGLTREFVDEEVARRTSARNTEDFKTADKIRDELLAKGINVLDLGGICVWEPKF